MTRKDFDSADVLDILHLYSVGVSIRDIALTFQYPYQQVYRLILSYKVLMSEPKHTPASYIKHLLTTGQIRRDLNAATVQAASQYAD